MLAGSTGNSRSVLQHTALPSLEGGVCAAAEQLLRVQGVNVTKYMFSLYIGVSRKIISPCSPLG